MTIQPIYGVGDLVQVGGDLRGDADGEVFPVGEVDVYTLGFQSFRDNEQGIDLGGSVVLRAKSLAYMFDESPMPGEVHHHVVLFCDVQVLVERVTCIGHPLTVNAGKSSGSEAR